MAALRSCWDPPYRSHHQQLVQPRWSPGDLAGQRRSRGVQPYDPPQPPHLRVIPSRLEMPQQQTYKQPPHYTGMGRNEQLIDLLDAATSRLESRWKKSIVVSQNYRRQKQHMDNNLMRPSIPEVTTLPGHHQHRPTVVQPAGIRHSEHTVAVLKCFALLHCRSHRHNIIRLCTSGQRQSRGIPIHDQAYGVPPYEQPRSPPDVYTGRQ